MILKWLVERKDLINTIEFDTRQLSTEQPCAIPPRHPTAQYPGPHTAHYIAHYIAPNTRKREMSRITGNE